MKETIQARGTRISVDRNEHPAYAGSVIQLAIPNLHGSGPSKYLLEDITLRKVRRTSGLEILRELKNEDVLKCCLSLVDGEAIQALGLDAFYHYLYKFDGGQLKPGGRIFLFKSIVLAKPNGFYPVPNPPEELLVPFLFHQRNPKEPERIEIGWFNLEDYMVQVDMVALLKNDS